MTNPYEADPQKVPQSDPYLARSPCYGRYHPQPEDFTSKFNKWYDSDSDAVAYWKDVIEEHCHTRNSLNERGSREAFAVGTVIIRIDQEQLGDSSVAEKYSCLNANELCAARKVEDILKQTGIAVPVILFCGTIDGRNITVESRIPGVSLDVAWAYLDDQQKQDLKDQCRKIVQRIADAGHPTPPSPSYVCRGLNTQTANGESEREHNILFADKSDGENFCLVHNATTRNNIIVNGDRMVGLLGWRFSGYFGLQRARQIHCKIRIGKGADALSTEEEDSWSDLYSLPLEGIHEWADADRPTPPVKTELPSLNLENLPVSSPAESTPVSFGGFWDGADDQHPAQPKQVSDLKRGSSSKASFSRASSSERSSPAPPSKLGPGVKKPSAASTKKGTATKKPPAKKLKVDAADMESVNNTRSGTPTSARGTKTPSVKKQGSTSAAGSPAPEVKRKSTSKKGNAGKRKKQEEETGAEESEEDSNELFCICRKPDNHTWMIGCDGGCEDWFHGKCVEIDPRDSDLIDKYICMFDYLMVIFGKSSKQRSIPYLYANYNDRSEMQGSREGKNYMETNVSSKKLSEAC
jgi:COMPASS component SPP1